MRDGKHAPGSGGASELVGDRGDAIGWTQDAHTKIAKQPRERSREWIERSQPRGGVYNVRVKS